MPLDWSHRHIVAAGASTTGLAGQHEPRLRYKFLQQNCSQTPGTSGDNSTEFDWEHNLGAPMAEGTFPAKYNFNLPGDVPACSDFVVFGLNTSGSSGHANLIGLDNLYSGTADGNGLCNSNPGVYQLYNPSHRWTYAATLKFAYNGSTIGGAITNSITMAEDGTKVAYVESTGSSSVFHVVSVPSGTDAPGGCYASKQTSCGAVATAPPSIKSVPASGSWSSPDSYSSVWVDYERDVAYVGTDNGVLHKVQNVFCSTPACKSSPVDPLEVNDGVWPVTLPGAGALSSPVKDASDVIYVAGANSGRLYAVTPAGAVTTSSSAFMPNSVVDGPLVDIDNSGLTQALYWFSNSKSDPASPSVRQPQMVQTSPDLANFHNFSLLPNGTESWKNSAIKIHTGAFDTAFYNNRSGNLWACGWWQNGLYAGNHQAVIRFGINGTTVTPDTSKAYAQTSPDWVDAAENTCAPLMDVPNSSGIDHLFVSSWTGYQMPVGTCQSQASCLAGFTVKQTGNPPAYSLAPFASFSLGAVGSTADYSDYSTGMIIDNTVDPSSKTCGPNHDQTCGQAASIYLMYGTYAIKVTQAHLQ